MVQVVFIIQCIHDFRGFANILLHISLKMGDIVKNNLNQRINFKWNFLKIKNMTLFLTRGVFLFFPNGHIYDVDSTFPNIAKIVVENDDTLSTLSKKFTWRNSSI